MDRRLYLIRTAIWTAIWTADSGLAFLFNLKLNMGPIIFSHQSST